LTAYTPTLTVHATTTAATVDRVTVTGDRAGLRIQNRSAADGLFYTWAADGTPADPAADGSVDGSLYLPPGGADTWEDPLLRRAETATKVHVISASPADYSVETWRT
jgi:hypothetical protein